MRFRSPVVCTGLLLACTHREPPGTAVDLRPEAPAPESPVTVLIAAAATTPAIPQPSALLDAGAADAGARALDVFRDLASQSGEIVDPKRGLLIVVVGPEYAGPDMKARHARTGAQLCGAAARAESAKALRALNERLPHTEPEGVSCTAQSCTRMAAGEWDSQETYWFDNPVGGERKLEAIVTVLDVPMRLGVDADFKWADNTKAQLDARRKVCPQ
jgi:hypothetical protein